MKRWKAGCNGMISVNSIFASFAVALVALLVTSATKTLLVQVCAALGVLAFYLFAHASESMTDALEEDDIGKYLSSAQEYNVAVVLLFVLVAAFLLLQGYRVVALLPLLLSWRPWLRDIYWLRFGPKAERDAYVQSLEQEDR